MFFTQRLALLLLGVSLIHTVNGRFPYCWLYWEMERARGDCQTQLQQQTPGAEGCEGEWNNVSCWRSAAVGEVLTLPCPSPFLLLFGKNGNLNRNCTENGWSSVYPDIGSACSSNISDEPNELVFYRVVQILSTLGHSLSLVALITSTAIICSFRRLHCMRNYIHLNLFVSFMLRAVAVLIKDTLLFSEDQSTDCSTQLSLVGCKASLVFFNYFVMANFFWLLVEGLYLHMLLLVVRTCWVRLSVCMLIGWGIPSVFTVAWIVSRINLEDTRCWEINDNPVPDRLINWPIMASIIINFLLFISIIRILVQKLRSSDVGGNDQSQYRRLAKSTLLLIPLFGVNYVVFFYLMEPDDETLKQIKIFFDLGLGSFQGLIVAVLYCFLNSEVQTELRRTWRSLSTNRCVLQDYRLRRLSANLNSTQFPRNTRAQSILQTETTML
ncbi:vasoactive intestinal polypeptide receptor 2-like [Xiphophorus maculatus]|uniref:Vasoactive intestinal peptide receptor 2 n=1 Tax=Xiphophorus maculatus TaxID=8083 RepID=A0A3B5QMZ1_XIPMA|nr:vasoactive intestinal polypeptide receptor 2-like [Xiphophorus maculatus]XP_023182104.1 vasoactive intestinal polypeptide receptor 2-like [Xiphophorus maculatus]XP_023182415.1 vasoactive intestinal polypeptide receptor 2-like [Xiphophorus maculatus]